MMPSRKKNLKPYYQELEGGFLALPHRLIESENFRSLSPHAKEILIYIAGQYKGNNNGDFRANWKYMHERGIRSKATLNEKLNELIKKGFIKKSRQGGLHQCNLFAITWQPVDECKGKHDLKPSRTATGEWKNMPVQEAN